jgi:hypothetical protein
MKIAAYAICRDEEKNVPRWLAATAACDFRLVVDTGSRDRSVSLLREGGVTVIERSWSPFRFDEARNWAIAHVPEGMDWLISPDFDEFFEPGWRTELETVVAASPAATQVSYPVLLHFGEERVPAENAGLKIHVPGYRWKFPVHEVLAAPAGMKAQVVHAPRLLQHHAQDPAVPREENYFALARAHLELDPENEWLLWFVFRGMARFRDEPDETIRLAERYLAITRPHTDFRSVALEWMGEAWFKKEGASERALLCFFRAASENPSSATAWARLGQAAALAGDLPLSYFALSRVSERDFPQAADLRARVRERLRDSGL